MDDNFPWEDLLDYIQDGKVMPVIGHELLQADYQGRQVSLQRLIAERLADREKLTVEWTRHFELNDAVCAYLAHPESKLGVLYDRIAGFVRSMAPPFPIPDALRRLAEIGPFDVFASLTFDSLMARALDQVRFGGNAVTKEIEFSINQSTAAQHEALKIQPGQAPVVFNLFGRANSKSEFAIHDEDSLEFIHRLVSGDVAPPEWLLSEFRNRHLLILGVHLPDWLGRFVLRAATRDRLRVASRSYFIAGENAPSGVTLAQFLHRFAKPASPRSTARPTSSSPSCTDGGPSVIQAPRRARPPLPSPRMADAAASSSATAARISRPSSASTPPSAPSAATHGSTRTN
jgi:hypothetical protein